MIRSAFDIFSKEVLDGLRDRRSLAAALLYSFLGPIAVGAALDALARRDAQELTLQVAIAGIDRAPAFRRFLENRAVVIVEATEDAVTAVRQGDLDAALVIPDAYPKDLRQGRPARIQLVYDSSRTKVRKQVDRIRGLLGQYGAELRTQRLTARGLSPDLATPVLAADVDLATPASRAAMAAAMLPIFLLVAAFVAGMNLAIDTTAGERERGSLRPLLLCPVPTRAVAIGKGLAAAAFGGLGVVLALTVTVVVLGAAPGAGARLAVGVRDLPVLLAILVPVAPFAGALQMLVAILCRSYKEAQTYLSLLLLLPMVPGFAVALYGVELSARTSLVPILGQQMLLERAIRGDTVESWAIAAAGVIAVGASVLCLQLCGRLLQTERIVCGR